MADPVDIKDSTPNGALIELLTKRLSEAKTGELRSMFMVCGWDDDCISVPWQIDSRTSANRFIGGLVRGATDFIVAMNLKNDDSMSTKMVERIIYP